MIAIVILAQHQQVCAQLMKRNVKDSSVPVPPISKLMLPLLYDDNHINPSSLKSSNIQAIQNDTIPISPNREVEREIRAIASSLAQLT